MTTYAVGHPLRQGLIGRTASALCRRRGRGEWDAVIRPAGVIALLGVPLVLLVPSAAGLTIFALITLGLHGPLSPVFPGAYEPVLIYFGQVYLPLTIAVVGTASSLYIEYVNYKLHQGLLRTTAGERISTGRMARRVVALFARRPAMTVWLCAWSPLPYWPVRILSPMAGLPIHTHLLATLLGRFPRLWFITAVGAQLNLAPSTLVAITAGSVLLAVLIWSWRQS